MRKVLIVAVVGFIAAACGLPFGLGLPSTSQLINGADDTIAKTSGFEITGSFAEGPVKYMIDMQYQASGSAVHMDVTLGSTHEELLQVNGKVYTKGQDVVAGYTGTDDFGQAAAKLIGSNYFATKSSQPIDLSGITNADKVKANFLTSATYSRKDHEQVNGQDTAELSDSAIELIDESRDLSQPSVSRARNFRRARRKKNSVAFNRSSQRIDARPLLCPRRHNGRIE